MPFVGLGLHVLVALFFAVHAVRTGQQTYWLFILFSFPLLGSIVYFLAIYVPNSRLEHGARKVVARAVKALDPTRELRDARAAFEYTPTAQNQMRLAAALLEAGAPDEAANTYEACLKGAFANDLDIRFGAARACVDAGRPADAVHHCEAMRAANPSFRSEPVSLLRARALAAAGRSPEARAEFEFAVQRFGSFESRAEFAIWAAKAGDKGTALRLQAEIEQATRRWTRHNRALNAALMHRLQEAFTPLNRHA
jgi:hypothetical protein